MKQSWHENLNESLTGAGNAGHGGSGGQSEHHAERAKMYSGSDLHEVEQCEFTVSSPTGKFDWHCQLKKGHEGLHRLGDGSARP